MKQHSQNNSEILFKNKIEILKKFCAFQERSKKQILDKMLKIGFSKNLINKVLEILENDNFYNEKRFALAYALGKFRNNKWGKTKIRYELESHLVCSEVLDYSLNQIDNDEYVDCINSLLEKKYQALSEEDNLKYEKLVRYAISKGFEIELVKKISKEIIKNNSHV